MTNLFAETPPTDDTSAREEILAKWKDKTPEEVLKAKVEADLFINTLTKRQDDLSKDYLNMKQQLDATASLQELRDQIVNAKATSNSEIPNAKEGTESQEPVDIDKKIKQFYEETRRIERQTANANMVQTKLKEHFGNSFQEVLRGTGLSEKQINEIAGDSPEAIFRLVGIDKDNRENFQAPPKSNQRSDSFAPKGQTKRDWNFYQELKKSNPKLYLDPKIAVQMHNDAIEQGEAFYG
jgi:hypothetical protein